MRLILTSMGRFAVTATLNLATLETWLRLVLLSRKISAARAGSVSWATKQGTCSFGPHSISTARVRCCPSQMWKMPFPLGSVTLTGSNLSGSRLSEISFAQASLYSRCACGQTTAKSRTGIHSNLYSSFANLIGILASLLDPALYLPQRLDGFIEGVQQFAALLRAEGRNLDHRKRGATRHCKRDGVGDCLDAGLVGLIAMPFESPDLERDGAHRLRGLADPARGVEFVQSILHDLLVAVGEVLLFEQHDVTHHSIAGVGEAAGLEHLGKGLARALQL